MDLEERIRLFLSSDGFGVSGASTNRAKYGNKILRCYQQHGKSVYPINPRADVIEHENCLRTVLDLPEHVKSLSIITPPKITEAIVLQAIEKGIKHIWMQPGAESEVARNLCRENGINVIAGGPCLLVVLGYREYA